MPRSLPLLSSYKSAVNAEVNYLNNKWLISYKFSLIGFILFSLYFGAPFIGVTTFSSFFTETLGCPGFLHFGKVEPCFLFGYDVSPRVALYKVPFANALITPIAYLYAFFELIMLWLITILFLRYMGSKEGKIVKKFNDLDAGDTGSGAKTRRPF